MKFFYLFRKELKEMLSVQTIVSMIIMIVILIMLGQVMSNSISDSQENSKDLIISDLDKTEFTSAVLDQLKTQLEKENGEMKTVDIQSDDYVSELKRLDIKNVVIIPKGFTDQVEQNKAADVEFVQKMNSLATMSNISIGSEYAKAFIEEAVKSTIYADKMSAGILSQDEIIQLEYPINLKESTVVADKSADISSSIVMSLCSAQGIFVPIIMFMLIMYSSQMILNAISTEKIDKTLETLLSAPVSRLSVLSSKMLASGVVAALQAAAYMIGMNKMMSGLMSDTGDTSQYNAALEKLGLTLSTSQYIMIGVQMFVSILIALALSLILGALAKDAKSAQTLLLPITFMTMIPYILSMVMDIKTATPVLKYLVYAIPFSHSFMASENAMFGNTTLYIGGLIYQIIILIICISAALKIFMSDRIFTMSIGGVHMRKKRNNTIASDE